MMRERLARDSIILRIQARAEPWFVVAGEDAFAMDLEHAAGGEAAKERLAHLRGIDAGLSRERERLGNNRERAADDHLVADLAELPRARFADPDDTLGITHRLEDRPDPRERVRVAAGHNRQRGVDRTDLAA